MKVHVFAGKLPHFTEHLLPIWHALPDSIKGGFHAQGRAATRANDLGVTPLPGVPKTDLVLVASYAEYRRCAPADVILLNHGAGQRYADGDGPGHSSYTGGRKRDRVVLHLCPREADAELNRLDGAEAVAIGPPCYLDPFFPVPVSRDTEHPTIALSFHSDVYTTDESRWAYPHYAEAVIDLARNHRTTYNIVGHAHPRQETFLRANWGRLKVPYFARWIDVLMVADLYICDNSSTLFEFAATGRPVLVLDAPWYRPDVEHGLRFWECADVGVRIQQPDQLISAIEVALADPPAIRKRREDIVRTVYAGPDGESLCDGRSTERAVEAICQLTRG